VIASVKPDDILVFVCVVDCLCSRIHTVVGALGIDPVIVGVAYQFEDLEFAGGCVWFIKNSQACSYLASI
jgi:hypothetical protein